MKTSLVAVARFGTAAGFVSAVLLSGLLAFAGTATASLPSGATATASPRTPAQCTNGANGFVNVAYNYAAGTTAQSRTVTTGVTVQLRFGPINGVQRGWARISGSTRPGDLVWMDWTTSGGSTWIQCGPFSVSTAGNPNTSAAQRTNSSTSWLFRACGKRPNGPSVCTSWT